MAASIFFTLSSLSCVTSILLYASILTALLFSSVLSASSSFNTFSVPAATALLILSPRSGLICVLIVSYA